ncbi:MAG: hypothetical protein ACQETH_14740 [Candidatus Rifleibacteriota bacterium]
MKKIAFLSRFAFVAIMTIIFISGASAQVATDSQGLPPIPETAQYSIDLADIYTEVFPADQNVYVICTLWLTATDAPVILRLEGNIQYMQLSSKSQPNLSFYYQQPYFYLNNLSSGAHQVTFTYSARHDGITSNGLISESGLKLDENSWWYPRNVADDPHQVILNIVTPPEYPLESNAELTKNTPNNFKQLRQFVLTQAATMGITLN